MFSKITILLWLIFTLALGAYTDIYRVSDCITCLSSSSSFVCRDNMIDSRSYCCDLDDTSSRCVNRNFCSNYTSITIMKLYSCPYQASTCSASKQILVVDLGKNETLATNSTFRNQTSCTWQIQSSNLNNGTTIPNNSYINIVVNSYNNTYLYINNGSNLTNVSSTTQITVSSFTGTNFTFPANQTIFVVASAFNGSPSVNFTYRYYQVVEEVPVCVNGTFQIVNGTRRCVVNNSEVVIINDTTKNETRPAIQEEVIQSRPQVEIIIMMTLILIGIVSFYIVDTMEKYHKSKKKEPKINITTLTDFELKPMDQQDMNYEEAVAYFNTARNSVRQANTNQGASIGFDDKMNGTIFDTYDKNMDTTKLGLVKTSKGDYSHGVIDRQRIIVNEDVLEENYVSSPLELSDTKRTHRENQRVIIEQLRGPSTSRHQDDEVRLPKLVGSRQSIAEGMDLPDDLIRKDYTIQNREFRNPKDSLATPTVIKKPRWQRLDQQHDNSSKAGIASQLLSKMDENTPASGLPISDGDFNKNSSIQEISPGDRQLYGLKQVAEYTPGYQPKGRIKKLNPNVPSNFKSIVESQKSARDSDKSPEISKNQQSPKAHTVFILK